MTLTPEEIARLDTGDDTIISKLARQLRAEMDAHAATEAMNRDAEQLLGVQRKRSEFIANCWAYWYGVHPSTDKTMDAANVYRHCMAIMEGLFDQRILSQPTTTGGGDA